MAAALLKVLCPLVKAANGGVTRRGVQAASPAVSGLVSASPSRMPVTGRQKLYAYLQSHDAIAASAKPMPSRAKSRAFSCVVSERCWEICAAI